MDNENTKFIVDSPLGYTVSCSEDTWNKHIMAGHPIMENNEQTVKDAITNPISVYKSSANPHRHVYFGDTENASYNVAYTKVIVGNVGADESHVTITAFPAKKMDGNIDGGELLYVSDKPRFSK